MTVFKYFFKLFWKKKFIILPYIIIFMIVSILTLPSNKNKSEAEVENPISIVIYNYEDTELTADMLTRLEGHEIFYSDDLDQIKEDMLVGKYHLALLMEDHPEERLIEGEKIVEVIVDATREEASSYAIELDQYFSFLELTYDGEFHFVEVENLFEEQTEMTVLDQESNLQQRGDRWASLYFKFSAYVTMAILITALGLAISDFQEDEVKQRNNISGTSYSKISKEIFFGQVILSLLMVAIQVAALVMMARGHEEVINVAPFATNLIILCFSILGIVNLLTALTSSATVITGVGNILSLGLAFVSGVFVNQMYLPDVAITVARFFPLYYYVNNLNATNVVDLFNWNSLFMIGYGILCLLLSLFIKREKLAKR